MESIAATPLLAVVRRVYKAPEKQFGYPGLVSGI